MQRDGHVAIKPKLLALSKNLQNMALGFEGLLSGLRLYGLIRVSTCTPSMCFFRRLAHVLTMVGALSEDLRDIYIYIYIHKIWYPAPRTHKHICI